MPSSPSIRPALNLTALGLVGSLTLGLAPFRPEPHLLGKLRWVAGGAEGMALMDWFDLVLHGTPWVVFGVGLAMTARAVMGRSAR